MWLTAAEDVTLGFKAFYRWFRAEVTARKDFLLAFVAIYCWFCACGVTVGATLVLNFVLYDRLCTPVTVEADILSFLIVFYNWFCKRATAEVICRRWTGFIWSLLVTQVVTLTTFINGGVFCYSFVFMLIRPTGLILVEIFFWILPMAARLERLICIKTKEY